MSDYENLRPRTRSAGGIVAFGILIVGLAVSASADECAEFRAALALSKAATVMFFEKRPDATEAAREQIEMHHTIERYRIERAALAVRESLADGSAAAVAIDAVGGAWDSLATAIHRATAWQDSKPPTRHLADLNTHLLTAHFAIDRAYLASFSAACVASEE